MSNRGLGRQGWLFGSGTDLLLGCGLGSMAIMLVQVGLGEQQLSRWVPGALLVLLFSLPHYGATLIRVYEDPADRRKYRVFSVAATLLVFGAFVASLYGQLFGSLLLTVYLTWSPWHYTGQNYGISLMLAGRRGVAFSSATKRWLHASFVSSYLLTFFAIHSAQPDGHYAPVSYGDSVFKLLPIGIPHEWVGVAIVLLGVAYAVSTLLGVVGLVRGGRFRAALPSLVLMATQALWFSVPVGVRYWELAGEGSIFLSVYTAYGFLWIAAYHAIQYLWITTYYGTESEKAVAEQPSASRRRLLFLGKAALMGYAVWTLPALLFAPGALGRLPHESGLALMVAAAVNLHHFILDGAVWKLRDGRVARVLLRSPVDPGPALAATPGARVPWLRRGLLGLGAVCLAYGALTFWVGDFGFAEAMRRGDLASSRQAIERLAWLGRDGPSRRTEFGRSLAREGQRLAARGEFRRSLQLLPTVRGFQSLGLLHEQAQEWQLAAAAYDSALALQPDDASTLFLAGRGWLKSGEVVKAVRLLERAARIAPEENLVALTLARARREAEDQKERLSH
jgi:Flp pilus assembly protein TadD